MKSLCMAAMLTSLGLTTSGAMAQNYAYYNPKSVSVTEATAQPMPDKIQNQATTANPRIVDNNLSRAAASPGWGDGYASGNCDQCGLSNACGCCSPDWYVNAKGLVMTRDHANSWISTFETGNNDNQLLGSEDASANWGGGFELFIGRNLDCCNAIEVGYFGIYGMNGLAVIHSDANQLSTPMDVGGVTIGGAAAGSFFDNAREHRITRNDEVHNIELNWVYHALGGNGRCNPLNIDLIAGVRYFQFSEDFQFLALAGTSAAGATYTSDPLSTAELNVDVQNHLVGFQIGTKIDWNLNEAWSLYFLPKVGIYGNHMTSHVDTRRGDGTYGVFTGDGSDFNLNSSKNGFSIVSSFDLGLNYNVTSNISVFGGYRVVAVSGIALSDNQIYPFLAGKEDFQEIKSNGNLLLHGAFAGVEFRW